MEKEKIPDKEKDKKKSILNKRFKKTDITFYNSFDDLKEEEGRTRLIHYGVAMSKGNWGDEKFKHIKFSIPHPHDHRYPQLDGIGTNKLHPSFISKKIDSHPEVKKLKKEGWRISEKSDSASHSKADVLNTLRKHAEDKFKRYGHYKLTEDIDLEESFSLDNSGKLTKDKRHIMNKFIDEDVRSSDYKMVLIKLPNNKGFGWRKIKKNVTGVYEPREVNYDTDHNTETARTN